MQVEFDKAEHVAGIAVEKGLEDNANIGVLQEFYLQFSNDGTAFWNQTEKNKKVVVSFSNFECCHRYFITSIHHQSHFDERVVVVVAAVVVQYNLGY